MAHNFSQIKGIDPAVRKKLEDLGVGTIEKLLEQTGTPAERIALAKEVGIPTSQLTALVNQADLMRLDGVGTELAALLEDCGVDSVQELRNRNATSLQARLAETNQQRHLAPAVPGVEQVQQWIDEAQEMVALG